MFICCGFCLVSYEFFYELLTAPLYNALTALGLEPTVKFRTVQGVFIFQLKSAFLGAIFFSAPWLFYQLWLFVAPGLYRRERRISLLFVICTTVFFFSGGVFCYKAVIPFSFEFFLSYARSGGPYPLLPDITLEDYMNFVTRLLIAAALIFETPIILAFFTWTGVLTYQTLVRGWCWAVFSSFVIAAILTPPDYITQILLALPLISFYGLSLVFAKLIENRRAKASNIESN